LNALFGTLHSNTIEWWMKYIDITGNPGTATCNQSIAMSKGWTVYPPIDVRYYDEGVIIDGVKWATRNVDVPGTFASSPEAPGMFYN